MRVREQISSTPIDVEQSVRGEEIRWLTSGRAGKVMLLGYIPVLREDRVSRGSVTISYKMAETVHPLMNATNVTAQAHFVPFLALDRFNGSMEAFNASYMRKAGSVPFFQTHPFDRAAEIYKSAGIHWKQGAEISDLLRESYNLLINYRRKARSEKLALRELHETTLAEAFWKNPNMYHIVPDFDAAMMDGEVALSINLDSMNTRVPVNGIGIAGQPPVSTSVARQAWGFANLPSGAGVYAQHTTNAPSNSVVFKTVGSGASMRPDLSVFLPDIFEQMRQDGLKIALSNIDLAKKTVAFAKLRERFSGIDDDDIIDMLMGGLRVPDEALKHPILLATSSTIFGLNERHAMDGDNLDKSVTTGETRLTLNFRTPNMMTGGVILITTEIVPEQLFERQRDDFLGMASTEEFPEFVRDFLDPEKVDVVQNRFVDVEHDTPDGTFGYAPLNHAWKRSLTRIGGKYLRPLSDDFVEDRQRFWSIEQKNPALTTDFYLVPKNLPHTVFADNLADPFEVLTLGNVQLVGNTVFGQGLTEDQGHYDAIASKVDHSRIAQEEL